MKYNIGFDLSGCELGVEKIIDGVHSALKKNPDINLTIFHHDPSINNIICPEKLPKSISERIEIKHTSEVISCHDNPQDTLDKNDSSLSGGLKFLKGGGIDGFVTPANTGAVVLHASNSLGKLPGYFRVGSAIFLPNEEKRKTMLMDVGGCVEVSMETLVQFAELSIAFYKSYFGENHYPRIGLLNIGEEPHKGPKRYQEAYQLLKNSYPEMFKGNGEGWDLISGKFDIILCEGFSANIALKATEKILQVHKSLFKNVVFSGILGKFAGLLLYFRLKKIKKMFSTNDFHGAVLLGLPKLVIVTHGSADSKSIEKSILTTAILIKNQVLPRMTELLEDGKSLKKAS